jgi:hypothetical protein
MHFISVHHLSLKSMTSSDDVRSSDATQDVSLLRSILLHKFCVLNKQTGYHATRAKQTTGNQRNTNKRQQTTATKQSKQQATSTTTVATVTKQNKQQQPSEANKRQNKSQQNKQQAATKQSRQMCVAVENS